MQESMVLSNKITNIEKSLKKKIKNIEGGRPSTDSKIASSRVDTENDEMKINCMMKGIGEIADLHSSSHNFFSFIKEGIFDCMKRILSREKFKNISLMDTLMKINKEVDKTKIEREALECKLIEMKEKQMLYKQADIEYKELKKQYVKCEHDRKKFTEQIDWLKDREEEVIKRMDLNEIDLFTERLGIYGVDVPEEQNPKPMKRHPKVPRLDFEKLYQMMEYDNEEEYEEEEEEAEEDVKSSQKKYLQDGSALVSNDSEERMLELQSRKEQVIALLEKGVTD
jgi:hypothetical protein